MDGLWYGVAFDMATNFSLSLHQLPARVLPVSHGVTHVKQPCAVEKGTEYLEQDDSDDRNAGTGRIP